MIVIILFAVAAALFVIETFRSKGLISAGLCACALGELFREVSLLKLFS